MVCHRRAAGDDARVILYDEPTANLDSANETAADPLSAGVFGNDIDFSP